MKQGMLEEGGGGNLSEETLEGALISHEGKYDAYEST